MALWLVTARSLSIFMADLVDEICTWNINKRKFASLVSGSREAADQVRQRRCVISVEPAVDGEYREYGDFDEDSLFVVFGDGTKWRQVR